jgi:calcineurin-like phosphoesterase family protein
MAKNFWVISDTHFGHENIITYCNRPYKNSEYMDWDMVEKWNSVVKTGDHVYHLGDVYMGRRDTSYIENILSKLNGKKRLILGNHDNGKDKILQKYFEKIDVWRHWKEFGILMTHVPVHESALGRGVKEGSKLLNIHGHIHTNPSPKGPYKCVCVEQINYTPVNIDELRHG